jgi:hypothetical protein
MTRFQWFVTMAYMALTLVLGEVTFFVSPARAGNTAVLPKGVFALDISRLQADTSVRWDANRTARPLIEGLQRYEPGGGLQGTITASPFVRYEFVTSQLFYGVTDDLTAAIALPWVTRTTIDPKLGWIPGDYQSGLGRAYSEDDFWQWAESMGQRKLTAFDGNRGVPADLVLGLRWRLPEAWTERFAGVVAAVAVQAALPTGVDPDPEELVAGGTKVWDLHNYGDAEAHLSLERPWREGEVNRANVGLDLHYAWLREREFVTPKGSKNPLLLTYAPYVGPTFLLDPGDMVGFSVLGEFAPWIGEARPVWIAKGDADVAAKFPAVLNLIAAYNFAHVGQSVWESKSTLWDWERMRLWQPGDKNTVKLTAEVSLMRFGVPVQVYAGYRNQEWVPGKNARASNVLVGGVRLLLKFW